MSAAQGEPIGWYLGRHRVLSDVNSDLLNQFRAIQLNRNDKSGNTTGYIIGTCTHMICGFAAEDEACLLLVGLQLMNLGFGVSHTLKGPDSLKVAQTCNPDGQCYGLSGGVCTQMHIAYLSVIVLPIHCKKFSQ